MLLTFQIEFIVLEIPFFAFKDITKCSWCNTVKSNGQSSPIFQKTTISI